MDLFIDVEWTAVSGATGYDINSILTIDGLSYHHSEATNVTGTSYRINDVTYYRPEQFIIAVRARNAHGPGAWDQLAARYAAAAATADRVEHHPHGRNAHHRQPHRGVALQVRDHGQDRLHGRPREHRLGNPERLDARDRVHLHRV